MSRSSNECQSQGPRVFNRLYGSGGTGTGNGNDESGILNEQVLVLVLESMKWDIHVLCQVASVCWRLRALAKRLLWRGVCAHRAPRMITTLISGSSRIDVGWHTIAKVMFFCCGCKSTRHFTLSQTLPGHFVKESRFSKTSGQSFLVKECRSDILYVSDPCEHSIRSEQDYLGVYRGVFRGFGKSRTRACLIRRKAQLEENVRCPYCGCRVWSMTEARLVPKTAARRLGSDDGRLEYFVCVNGHLHGSCWLMPLSSDSDDSTPMEGFQSDRSNGFSNGSRKYDEDMP